MKDRRLKILCVCDGGITRSVMEPMRELEQYGAQVEFVEDREMDSMAAITERMLFLEQEGVEAAPPCRELLEACRKDKGPDILVVHVAAINRQVIELCPNLKVAAVLRGGFENADKEELARRGIPLINAPWRSADAVADFTVGMMIAENKNIARSHRMLFEGSWCKHYVNQNYIYNMRNCTVGLIGYGYIGSRVARRLKGFGCRVLVCDPFMEERELSERLKREQKEERWEPGMLDTAGLSELLETSDFVSLHLRLSQRTKHYIGAEELAKMKPTGYLINTARAGLVDTEALAEALSERKIGGAAIDVFDEEPIQADHPYLGLDNITLTSHLAGTSCDTMQASVEIGMEELKRYLTGEKMRNVRNL